MKNYNALLEKVAAQYDAPSVVMSVRQGDKVEYFCYGEADRARKVKADENTIYYIGSCSKAFIATAVAMLADDGLLTLDTPVKELVPNFRLATEELTNGLLVRDVLSHTAGLEGCDMMWQTAYERPISELVDMLHLMKPVHPFRTHMDYLNNMYALASHIVTLVTGKPWDEYVKARIWEPLGMTRTFARAAHVPKDEKNRTVGYQIIDGKTTEVGVIDPYDCVGAAGSILSTLSDMDKWLRFNAQGCVWNGERLISEEMEHELHSPQTVIHFGDMMPVVLPGVAFENYALGWFMESLHGSVLLQHGGSIEGHNTKVGVLPEKGISVAVLTNLSRRFIPDGIMYDVLTELLGAEPVDYSGMCTQLVQGMMAQMAAEMPALPETPTLPEHPLEAYAGSFANEIFGKAQIKAEGGVLSINAGNLVSVLTPVGGDNFLLSFPLFDLILPVQFTFGAEGKAQSFAVPLEPTEGLSSYTRINA